MSLSHNDGWYLVGGIRRGIGRTWLAWAHSLSEVDPGDTLYEAAPTEAAARRWLRQASGDLRLRYEPFGSGKGGGQHAYCAIKHVEMD